MFDYDNDGDLDLLVIGQKPVYKYNNLVETESVTHLYHNDLSNKNNWLKVALKGVASDTKGIGSRVTVVAGNLRMIREIDGGSSHLSQNSTLAHFGLGTRTRIDSIIVNWLGGQSQIIVNVPVNQIITIKQITANNKIDIGRIVIIILILSALIIIGFLFRYNKKYSNK